MATENNDGGAERLTVSLTTDGAAALQRLRQRNRGMSKTDAINRALVLLNFIDQSIKEEGTTFLLRDENGELERIQII